MALALFCDWGLDLVSLLDNRLSRYEAQALRTLEQVGTLRLRCGFDLQVLDSGGILLRRESSSTVDGPLHSRFELQALLKGGSLSLGTGNNVALGGLPQKRILGLGALFQTQVRCRLMALFLIVDTLLS